MDRPLRCIVCNKQPESIDAWTRSSQPYAATEFISYGHYGSTVWDPPPTGGVVRKLTLNVCDDCLSERHDRLVVLTEIPTPNDVTYAPWDPDNPI